MRLVRHLVFRLVPLSLGLLSLPLPLIGQDPPTPPAPAPVPAPAPEEAPAAEKTDGATEAPTPRPSGQRRRPRRAPAPLLVLRAGTVHPIDGPPIENGVVVIQGERIRAVGAADEVEVPAGATVLDYP